MFRNTGANAFAKNQMRLAYEDKRDLYCNIHCMYCLAFVIPLGILILLWGQGVDSVSYPGPSIHPIMSEALKMYILLYIYVITME